LSYLLLMIGVFVNLKETIELMPVLV
jgi:hypothetical protein